MPAEFRHICDVVVAVIRGDAVPVQLLAFLVHLAEQVGLLHIPFAQGQEITGSGPDRVSHAVIVRLKGVDREQFSARVKPVQTNVLVIIVTDHFNGAVPVVHDRADVLIALAVIR